MLRIINRKQQLGDRRSSAASFLHDYPFMSTRCLNAKDRQYQIFAKLCDVKICSLTYRIRICPYLVDHIGLNV